MITKAVIPAAGLGTRFLPATKAQPKEMLPLIDTPTIQYVVEEAKSSGIEDILVIIGRDKGSIEDHFDRAPELEEFLKSKGKTELLEVVQAVSHLADLHFIRQKVPMGLGHAVLSARRHVGQHPFSVLLGDDVFVGNPPVLKQLIDRWRPGLSVVAVKRVSRQEASRYGIAFGTWRSDGTLAVSHLVEKPRELADDVEPLAVMGRYVLDPGVFDALDGLAPGAGGEIQLTDALDLLARDGQLIAVPFQGERYDVGEKLGFVKATIEVGLSRPDLREQLLEYLQTIVREYSMSELLPVAKG